VKSDSLLLTGVTAEVSVASLPKAPPRLSLVVGILAHTTTVASLQSSLQNDPPYGANKRREFDLAQTFEQTAHRKLTSVKCT